MWILAEAPQHISSENVQGWNFSQHATFLTVALHTSFMLTICEDSYATHFINLLHIHLEMEVDVKIIKPKSIQRLNSLCYRTQFTPSSYSVCKKVLLRTSLENPLRILVFFFFRWSQVPTLFVILLLGLDGDIIGYHNGYHNNASS
jgi:hypothetical protein